MQTIENGKVTQNVVTHLGAEDALPASGRVSVSLERFAAEQESLTKRGDVGIRLESTQTAEEIAPYLDAVAFVALDFPKFADGRHYSTARLLRDKYNYSGELRATGDILRDQLFYLQRCGFDVLELRADKDATAALGAFEDFSVTYQAASDGEVPVYLRD